MIEKNIRDKLNISDMLNVLDSLQEKHMNLLNDMQGHVNNNEDLFKPLGKTEPMPLEMPEEDVKDVLPFFQNETVPYDPLPLLPNSNSCKLEKMEKKPLHSSKNTAGKTRRFVSAILFYGFIICMIGGAFLISQGNKKSILGYYFMNVLTWSMESEIPQGSMVLVKQVDPGIIEIGDDITYMKDKNTLVTHRVIGITENYDNSGKRGFETQGTENDNPDFDIVPEVNVVGVVKFHIPKLGNWLEWLQDNLIITLIFTAGFILLIVLVKGALKKSPAENKESCKEIRRVQSIN